MRTIRWGMIGCGDVTERKSGPAFMKARNSTLVSVMRRDGALAADYARRHGVLRSSNDAADIIDADDVDAIYIATHTNTHKEYTLRCAAAGKPVYVEKPMGMDHPECREMINACRAADVSLWVGYYRRALPRFLAIRDLIGQGAIGEVRLSVSYLTQRLLDTSGLPEGHVPWRVDPALSGGGLFFEGACHTFDFLDFLFGPIVELRSFCGNQAGRYRAEDIVTATYRFASGIYGSGAWCYSADHDSEYTELIGSNGRLLFSVSSPAPIRLTRGNAVEEIPIPDPEHVHQPMIQTIVDELNDAGRCESTGESAARTARIMDEVVAQCREHFSQKQV